MLVKKLSFPYSHLILILPFLFITCQKEEKREHLSDFSDEELKEILTTPSFSRPWDLRMSYESSWGRIEKDNRFLYFSFFESGVGKLSIHLSNSSKESFGDVYFDYIISESTIRIELRKDLRDVSKISIPEEIFPEEVGTKKDIYFEVKANVWTCEVNEHDIYIESSTFGNDIDLVNI